MSDPYCAYAGVNERMYDRRVTTKSDFEAISNLDKLIYLGGYNGICEDLDGIDEIKKRMLHLLLVLFLQLKSYLTLREMP